jgi:phage shock protein PspC (stress-responsive transcriptional regulator)
MPKKKDKKEKHFEEGVEHFAEEVEQLGKRFERRAKRHKEHFECFSAFGPLLSSLFSILLLGIFIWINDFLNLGAISSFFMNLRNFFAMYIALFFALSLAFSYSDYASKKYHWFIIFKPLVFAGKVVFAVWVLGNILSIINMSLNVSILSTIAFYMLNSFWLFGLVAVLGYMVLFLRFIFAASWHEKEEVKMKKGKPQKFKRLYRTGEEKILGGVCGGIAEYLEVDPVLIRLLWVAISLVYGSGLLLYIIAWIIIPRNPNHKW